MTHESRVIPDEIRVGAQKPLSFLKFIANKSVWIVVVIIIAVTVIGWLSKKAEEYEKRKKLDLLGTKTESSYEQMRETKNGVRSEKVVAYPGEWTRKEVPHGYDWISTRDLRYGLENANRLLWVRIDGGTTKDEGMRKDGSTAVAVFTTQADYVEFMSGEKEPIYLDYNLMKRR